MKRLNTTSELHMLMDGWVEGLDGRSLANSKYILYQGDYLLVALLLLLLLLLLLILRLLLILLLLLLTTPIR